MDKNRALEIMKTKRCCVACVERNGASECYRKCKECDLVLPTKEVLEAYDLVIALLTDEPVGVWVHEYDEKGLPTFKHQWRCPVCGKAQTYGEPPHCPFCGARVAYQRANVQAQDLRRKEEKNEQRFNKP